MLIEQGKKMVSTISSFLFFTEAINPYKSKAKRHRSWFIGCCIRLVSSDGFCVAGVYNSIHCTVSTLMLLLRRYGVIYR